MGELTALPQTSLLDLDAASLPPVAGLGKRIETWRGGRGKWRGGKGRPQVTVETGPLRDLLCHCVTSFQILMLPVNIVFTM